MSGPKMIAALFGLVMVAMVAVHLATDYFFAAPIGAATAGRMQEMLGPETPEEREQEEREEKQRQEKDRVKQTAAKGGWSANQSDWSR